jgi:hypothetical protein
MTSFNKMNCKILYISILKFIILDYLADRSLKANIKTTKNKKKNGQNILQQAKHKNLLHYRYVNLRAVCQPVGQKLAPLAFVQRVAVITAIGLGSRREPSSNSGWMQRHPSSCA